MPICSQIRFSFLHYRSLQYQILWDNTPGRYSARTLSPGSKIPPEVTPPPAECSNILKGKIWKLALTCIHDLIRPRRRDHDPNRPTGVTSGGFSLGVISAGECLKGSSIVTKYSSFNRTLQELSYCRGWPTVQAVKTTLFVYIGVA